MFTIIVGTQNKKVTLFFSNNLRISIGKADNVSGISTIVADFDINKHNSIL